MTTKVNEFSMNLPVISPPETVSSMPDQGVSAAIVQGPSDDPMTMTIGSPVAEPIDPKTVSVFANNISPISYSNESDDVVAFDIVFSVGITCADGACKTYQVVKRIGIDRARIAAEAECNTPMSIVEAVKAPTVKPLKEARSETAARARRLAGLE